MPQLAFANTFWDSFDGLEKNVKAGVRKAMRKFQALSAAELNADKGLHLESGRHLAIVDQIEDMAAELLKHMRDPGPIQRMAEAGREEVVRRYDWDILADRLERIWLDCAGR